MGIPTNIAGLSVSALFGRAYNLIYNEWFRDQNLQDSIPVPRGDECIEVTPNFIRMRKKILSEEDRKRAERNAK